MSQTLSHTVVLQAPADDLWEACKHADKILCELMPEYFGKTEFLQGHGEPGSIRVITTGTAIPHANQLKERVDKFDDATKTLGYTVLEGDPRYSAFSAEIQFVARAESVTDAIWTAKYEPVGYAGPPEHIKVVSALVFQTLERAVKSKKTFTFTDKLDVSPEAIWKACKNVDEILGKSMSEYFASVTLLEGHGEAGTIRHIKMGPAVEFAGEVTERVDFIDDAGKKLGYTVLKGDPRYKFFAGTLQFTAGPSDGTTNAVWVATYVPEGEAGPPEHIKAVVSKVLKALEAEVKAHPELYA